MSGIELKSAAELEVMRRANGIVVEVHKEIRSAIRPGISTLEMDEIARRVIGRHDGARPVFRGYKGFPASICVSVDAEVVHGIPSASRIVEEGSIVSIDVGVKYRGFVGDAAVSYPVGKIDGNARRLLEVTRGSLYAGIAKAVVGGRLSDISHAIEQHVRPHGYGIVKEYVGHGVGRQLHEEPQVPNFGAPGKGPRLAAGMTLAIEPMINEGTGKTKELGDRWTVVTADGKRSAHFEHSIALTGEGPEILSIGLPDDVV